MLINIFRTPDNVMDLYYKDIVCFSPSLLLKESVMKHE